MKKVVFINQDSGYLMIDIINAHVEAGYICTLITGRLVERNNKLQPSVHLDKIIRYNRGTPVRRVSTWVWATVQILFKILLKHRNDHLFIVSNPPLAPLLPLFIKNPFSLYIFDIYPDALVDNRKAGANRFYIRMWLKFNRKVFARAARIFTLTNAMRDKLSAYTGKTIDVIPVWSDNTYLKPIPCQENSFIKEHGLSGKFVVLYSGNLGFTHHTEVIAEIAARITNPAVMFLFIGEGDGKERLSAKISSLKLTNCMLLPWQPPENLPYSLASASLGIVSLGSNSASLSIPSKTFNLMSVGAPLLCLAPLGSELEKLVKNHGNGKCFDHDQVDDIVGYINKLATDGAYRQYLSANSLKASEDYTVENVKRFLE